MTIHHLKIKSHYLVELLEETKKCEVRYNDRNYQVGDLLEFSGDGELNCPVLFKITHIETFAQVDDYVVLSVEKTAQT